MPRPMVQIPVGTRFGRLVTTSRTYLLPDGGIGKSCVDVECDCGTRAVARTSRLRNGWTRSCGCLQIASSRERHGSNNPSWKGGWAVNDGGYKYFMTRRPDGKSQAIFEHVLVMEQHLGRPLRDGETVHHKYGVKDDNRIENLELWSTAQPSGQRVEDKTEWAIEWLKQYKPEVLKECLAWHRRQRREAARVSRCLTWGTSWPGVRHDA